MKGIEWEYLWMSVMKFKCKYDNCILSLKCRNRIVYIK